MRLPIPPCLRFRARHEKHYQQLVHRLAPPFIREILAAFRARALTASTAAAELGLVAEALRGFGTESEVSLSPGHESSLLMKLRNAKTKSQRDEIYAERGSCKTPPPAFKKSQRSLTACSASGDFAGFCKSLELRKICLQHTPSLPDARPSSDRFRCGGRESKFLQ